MPVFAEPNIRSERLALGAGGLAENAFQNAPLVLANPIFNIGMGVSPVVIGVAMAIPRFWEMLLDPWIGVVSDRTRSRWGRRAPFVVAACVACMALFALIWWVPATWGVWGKGAWLIACSFLFYTAYSFFAVPYAALTIDETREGADRVSVMTIRVAFANVASLGMNWLYWLCQRDFFESPLEGIRWVGLAFGVGVGLTGLLPVWVAVRKRRARGDANSASVTGDVAHEEKSRRRGEFRAMLRIPAMRWVIFSLMSILMGFTLVGHLGFYLIAYHACGGDLKKAALVMGISATVTSLVGVIGCPIIAAVAKRVGKLAALQGLLGIGVAASLSQWWLITPANPYLSIVSATGGTIGLIGFLSLMPAFLGDVSDDQLARTGIGSQGTLAAIYGVAVKLGASMALMATGYVLVVCGFRPDMPLDQMAEPVRNMRLFYAVTPALAGIGAILAMRRFRVGLGTTSAAIS